MQHDQSPGDLYPRAGMMYHWAGFGPAAARDSPIINFLNLTDASTRGFGAVARATRQTCWLRSKHRHLESSITRFLIAPTKDF